MTEAANIKKKINIVGKIKTQENIELLSILIPHRTRA
jgi:hypothetical protein